MRHSEIYKSINKNVRNLQHQIRWNDLRPEGFTAEDAEISGGELRVLSEIGFISDIGQRFVINENVDFAREQIVLINTATGQVVRSLENLPDATTFHTVNVRGYFIREYCWNYGLKGE